MKHLIKLLVALAILSYSCTSNPAEIATNSNEKIKVAVFEGHGGSQTCVWEVVEAIKIDKEMEVCIATTSDIANGALAHSTYD